MSQSHCSVIKITRHFGMALKTLGVALVVSCASFADDGSLASDELRFADSASEGMLFVDGQFIPGPYTFSASESVLDVNGHTIEIPIESKSSAKRNEARTESRSQGRRRQMGDRGPGGPGGPRNNRGRRPRPFEEEDSLEEEYYEEMEEPQGATRVARRIAGWLQNDYVVFFNSPSKTSFSSDASQVYPLFEMLLSPVPTDDQVAWYNDNRSSAFTAEEWTAFHANIKRTPQLRSEITRRMSDIERLEADNESRVRAVQRMQNLAYPLTVIGMLLSVVAFGHMLQWSGRGLAAISDKDVSPESVRYGVVALWLMMGMSVVDLCWTVLASQAGAMQETNPLAAGLLDSPMRLAAFKVMATGVGLGILYAWRRRAQIQQATWWMCLVCVLLTFRWVVFDSLSS